jgi:hypothetical protein
MPDFPCGENVSGNYCDFLNKLMDGEAKSVGGVLFDAALQSFFHNYSVVALYNITAVSLSSFT